MDVAGSQVWFTDLWNYSVVPYLMEAVREGLQVYGRRCDWEDPAVYVVHSYPWAGDAVHSGPDALIRYILYSSIKFDPELVMICFLNLDTYMQVAT